MKKDERIKTVLAGLRGYAALGAKRHATTSKEQWIAHKLGTTLGQARKHIAEAGVWAQQQQEQWSAATTSAPVDPQKARHDRENELMAELCRDHGYSFSDSLPSRESTQMVWHRDAKDDKAATIKAHYVIKLMIPADSALGQNLAKARSQKKF